MNNSLPSSAIIHNIKILNEINNKNLSNKQQSSPHVWDKLSEQQLEII